MRRQYLTLREHPEVRAVVLAAFPDYRKHKASIGPFHPININSYWDGGSRAEFAVVELATLRRHDVGAGHCYFDVARQGLAGAEDQNIEVDRVGNVKLKNLPPGFALVEAGTSCGKPAMAAVYVHPDNLTKLLP